MWEGTVVSIHVAAEASASMQSITEVRAFPGRGLEGDRYFAGTGFYSKKSSHGGREVTLIEVEAVEALFGGVLNAEGERFGIKLAAAGTRRNIATSSGPLNHLVDREFWVGAVLMRGTRLSEPCKHLESVADCMLLRSFDLLTWSCLTSRTLPNDRPGSHLTGVHNASANPQSVNPCSISRKELRKYLRTDCRQTGQ